MLKKILPNDKIVFTIVGADFFRKGGREVLLVFDQLISKHPQIQLNIVSSMKYGDYATHTIKADQDNTLDIISKYPNNIKHYYSLPNTEVLELLKNTHVGLLPTWADSFGYSVLESQAAGCPVITTDIRALPEINNDEIGWVVKVPKDINGNAKIDSKEDRGYFEKILKLKLKEILIQIIEKPHIVKSKGEEALERIKSVN